MTSQKFIHEFRDRSRKRSRPVFFRKLGRIMQIGTVVGGAIAGTGIAIALPWVGVMGAVLTIIGATGAGITRLAVDFEAEKNEMSKNIEI